MTPATWTLDALFAPLGWQRFLDEAWQRRPWRIARGDRGFFSPLCAIDEVDFLIAANAGREDFALSVMGRRLDDALPEALRGGAHGRWTPAKVYERLAEGATIRIGNTVRHLPNVARLAAAFEAGLQTDVKINLYYTPRRSQAFEAHYDNHDVFIVQIAGAKRWRLYHEAERWPVEVVHRGRLEWYDLQTAIGYARPPRLDEDAAEDVVLEAGDLLYVPRGHVHRVCTLDDAPSLHLTVATPVVTWYEVCVHALLSAFRRSDALREALPPDFATAPGRIDPARFDAVAAALAAQVDGDALRLAVAEMGRRFLLSRRDHWQGMADALEDRETLAIDQPLRLRPHLLWTIDREPTRLIVHYRGHRLPVPIRCESMLRHILAGDTFRPSTLPTHLDDESRLVFCRAALQHGLIVRVHDADAEPAESLPDAPRDADPR